MSPQPLESLQGGPCTAMMPTGMESAPRGGSISLSMLIDFIIQRTYHELTVLAELLPRKTDMERKIEIYNFSARTRQLFIRLLALVKWANSASKVDKSAHIMSFLDKQSMLFVETADMLARMARETLVHARLPNFHIPAAIEILTTGSYARLPSIIRDRIVPPDPITLSEKRQTLLRLNQVIQHRLVTGNLLPQMRKFKIEAGRVTFHVDHEFEVSLTVMGDAPTVPWRLLDIDILVEDKETGDGKALVHTLQVNYIHQLIQARLVDNQNALAEVYNCLHFFCQSLQLEVLYTQTLRLIMDRLEDNVHVDEYVPGWKLTVSYWRELTNKDPKSELGYRLTVQTDPNDTAKPLAVFHLPSIGNKESSEVADRAVRSDHLSMERLLVHTVYIRSLSRLNDIKAEFMNILKDVDFIIQGTPAVLTIPILSPCLRAEQVHITVDTHTGMLRCHVPKHLECPIVPELQSALNNDYSKLSNHVSELRFWITKRRCEKTLQHLPATAEEKLSFAKMPDHIIEELGKHKIFIRLHHYPDVIMVVKMDENPENNCDILYKFFLCMTEKVTDIEDAQQSKDPQDTNSSVVPKVFLKVESLIELDSFVCTHGPGTYIDEFPGQKRKASTDNGPISKVPRTIYPAYFIPDLAHVVAMCDEKMPFILLARELSDREIPHSGLEIEANASSIVLKILSLPKPQSSFIDKKLARPISIACWEALERRLLSVSFRSSISRTVSRWWNLELVFFSSPLQSSHPREQGFRRPIYFQYDINSIHGAVDSLIRDWQKIVYLYTLVHDFAEKYNSEKSYYQNIVAVKSYTYTNLILNYGPNFEVTVNVFWCSKSNEFKLVFNGGNSAINAHSMMKDQLQAHLNKEQNLAHIVQMLHETYQSLSSIAKLPVIPHLGIQRSNIPVLSFCIMPQSATLIKVTFQSVYCLEIRLLGSGLVSIRDGAFSHFDGVSVVGELIPSQGLKSFLSKYVDETAVYKRRSQTEDDNPPSPIMAIDDQGGPTSVGVSSQFLSGRAPQSPRDPGLRFASPMTPPSSSNPHTPASPHPINQGNPNHPNFSMTSPPAPHLPHPSPSGMMPSSPLNPQPSPMANSPGPNSLPYMQAGHLDNSPFTALSPSLAGNTWPGSPSIPRPASRPGQSPEHKNQGGSVPHMSRILPARSWAGAVPTLLTSEALEILCKSCPNPLGTGGFDLSPLERFLGCIYLRRHLQRLIHSEEPIIVLKSNEKISLLFKIDNLQYHVFLHPTFMQSLHLKVSQMPHSGPTPDNKPPYQWTMDDLQTLELYFESRVAVPPYRINVITAFLKMLCLPPQVLRDFIQIMHMELHPEMHQNLKWTVQFCLRIPPSSQPIVPVGQPGVIQCKVKILFLLQLTRIPYMQGDWKDMPSLVLPFVYDISTNVTQLAQKSDQVHPMALNNIYMLLRNFDEMFRSMKNECSLFPAISQLAKTLTLPNEPQPPQNTVNQVPPNQVASPMVQSPMQQSVGQSGPMPPQQQGYSNMGPN